MANQPTGVGDPLGLLAQLAQKPVMTNIWYHAKKIKLDGYKFVSCRFDKCELHVTTTNFVIDHCVIDVDTVIFYGSEILKPIQLYNSRTDWLIETGSEFAPTKNQDGTISIGA